MSERPTFRDENTAKHERKWNRRFEDPFASQVNGEVKVAASYNSAQSEVDQRHAFENARYGDPVAFLRTQLERAPYILDGVQEHPIFQAVRQPAPTEA